jgi:hypothetical protein
MQANRKTHISTPLYLSDRRRYAVRTRAAFLTSDDARCPPTALRRSSNLRQKAYFPASGSGIDRSAGSCGTARNSIGGDCQSQGASGIKVEHSAKSDRPSEFRISKTRPVRASSAQRPHSFMGNHSVKAFPPNTFVAAAIVEAIVTAASAAWNNGFTPGETPGKPSTGSPAIR